MSDDARRSNDTVADVGDDAERRRALIHAARARGDTCAGCGRALAAGEPVWWAAFAVRGLYGRRTRRRAPVGRECAPPELVRATEGREPEPCLGCGRAIRYGVTSSRRRLAICSKRCAGRYRRARAKEERR